MLLSKTQLLLVVLLPLLGSILAGLFGRKIGRVGAHTVTILGVAASCVLSVHVLWQLMHGAAVFNVVPFLDGAWERRQVEKFLGRKL